MKRRFPTDLETAQSLNKVQREELVRLRGEAEKKDAQITALADALEHTWRNATDLAGADLDAIRAALRLVGRLP